MKKIYDSKAFWIIVSLLASLSIWVYVTGVDSEEFKQTFRGVRVELIGTENLRENKNLVITDLDTNTVTVELVGPRRIVGALDSSDIVAQIDVSKLTQSAYTSQQYYLSFPDGIDTSRLEVRNKIPATVNFMVSSQTKKTIPVRGGFEGTLAEGYTAEMPVFEPSTITISGAESYLKNIDHAWVSFGKDLEIESTYSVDVGFTLIDTEGNASSVTGISFSNDTVKATLPILEVKEVMLAVDLVEGSGANSTNTKVTIEPKSVTLAGDSAILKGINKIVLDTIDLTDFTSTYTETYTIALDNDVRNITGVSEAKVTVEIIGLETRTLSVKNIALVNAEGLTAELLSESVDVHLRGAASQLENIKAENLRAVADLADFKEASGTYLVPVKIYVDGFTDVGAVGDYTISVDIRKD